MTGLPLLSETHGGDDVPIYSRGPFSHLFTGVNHQSIIPHVIAYAACLEPPIKGYLRGAHCPPVGAYGGDAAASSVTSSFVPPAQPVMSASPIKTRRKARI